MPWPSMMPPDLRRAIDRTLSLRNVEAADIWCEFREWLICHGAVAPDLPEDRQASATTGAMRDQ